MINTVLTRQRPPQQLYALEPTEAVAGEFADAEIGVEKIDFVSKLFTPEDLGDEAAVGVQPGGTVQPAQDAADSGGVHRADQGGTAGGAVTSKR